MVNSSDKHKIMVTGASGFLGSSLCTILQMQRIPFLPVFGTNIRDIDQEIISCDLSGDFDLRRELSSCDTVVHCAGMAHSKSNRRNEDLFYKVNSEGLEKLSRQASEEGITKFILISSAGVMGRKSEYPSKISITDSPKPYDSYTFSKLKGEEMLIDICSKSNMSYCILRPPLIYGKDAPGNWETLVKFLKYGIPLPLGKINNKRSFIFIENLLDIICKCIRSNSIFNEIFLVSDNQDISTSELVELILKSLNKKGGTFKIDQRLIIFLAYLIGRQDTAKQLFNNLQLDVSETEDKLQWKPKYKIEEAIRLSLL